MAKSDAEILSEDERQRREREERKRAFLASPDYARWLRLRRLQEARFKRSVDESKAIFDFLRMVLTTALLCGLLVFVIKSAPVNSEGEWWPPVTSIAIFAIAALTSALTLTSANRFASLIATRIAIANLWPFKAKRGRGSVLLYLSLWTVQLFFLSSSICIAWLVAEQATLRVHVPLPPRTSSSAPN